MTTIGI
jgi:hypothetical protein